MSILNASILFTRANNVRGQLDYISGHENISGSELLVFNNLIRVFDKIYMSTNTREHRRDLQNFIAFNADAIYKKYVELTNSDIAEDSDEQKEDSDDSYDLK